MTFYEVVLRLILATGYIVYPKRNNRRHFETVAVIPVNVKKQPPCKGGLLCAMIRAHTVYDKGGRNILSSFRRRRIVYHQARRMQWDIRTCDTYPVCQGS